MLYLQIVLVKGTGTMTTEPSWQLYGRNADMQERYTGPQGNDVGKDERKQWLKIIN